LAPRQAAFSRARHQKQAKSDRQHEPRAVDPGVAAHLPFGRLALDGTAPETAVLMHQASRDTAEAPAPADGPPATGRGRRKATGAA
jgi:hypothetical protein